jgi:hypothetical protein
MACSLKGRCSIPVRWNISPGGWPRCPGWWRSPGGRGRLTAGQGRLAAAGVRVLNEMRLTERAGLDAIQDRLVQPGPDLGPLFSDVRARLELSDGVWAGG